MLELLKRIDRQKFDITYRGYYHYSRGEGEMLASVLISMNLLIIFIGLIRQPLMAKIKKELVRSLLFYSSFVRKSLIYSIDYRWRILPDTRKIRAILQPGYFDMLYMHNQPSASAENYLSDKDLKINAFQHCRIYLQLNSALIKLINVSCDATIAASQGVQSLQAFPYANGKMVIVGDVPAWVSLEQLTRQLNIQHPILFTGFRNNALDSLSAFDVFILALLSKGLPRVVLESMLVNTAITGACVTGTVEFPGNGKTGLLFDDGDVHTLCQHLTLLYQSEMLRQTLVTQANIRVRQFPAVWR